MKEKKGSFLSEFAQSWVGQLSLVLLIALTVLIVMLQLEWFPFHNLSVFLSEDKYSYTFKMIEITVSILAFSALVWSISYQRDELLQSRHELKVQSEDVNRSIDEANKNFDRELLLEFYRKITDETQGVDFNTSSFLVESQYRIYRERDEYIAGEIQNCIGNLGFTTPVLQRLLSQIQSKLLSIGADDDQKRLLQDVYSDSQIKSAIRSIEESLCEVESEVLILLYDMIFYAKNKEISLEEPVFSLLRNALKKSGFFMNSKSREYRLSAESFNQACMDLGLIEIVFNEGGIPYDRKFKSEELGYFIDSLHSLGLIGEKEEFCEIL